jgi:hypothetical protein
MHRRRLPRHRPAPSMIVALLALFLVGGAGYAATGGSFILGQANTASSPSSLTASINDRSLKLTNMNTGTGASVLGLNVVRGHPPFLVNSDTKVTNLNADKLDGFDSASFLKGQGKVWTFARTIARGAVFTPFPSVSSFMNFRFACPGTDEPSIIEIVTRNTGFVGMQVFVENDSFGNRFFEIAPGGASNIATRTLDVTTVTINGGAANTLTTITIATRISASSCLIHTQAVITNHSTLIVP